jgi:hypothetical protein
MSRSKFDMDYYNWLRKVEVTEADSVWEDVQYELDFADTWKNISNELDRVAPVSSGLLQGSLIKTAVITTTMLFFLLVPSKRLDDPGSRQDLTTLNDATSEGNMDFSPLINIPDEQSITKYISPAEKRVEQEGVEQEGVETVQKDVVVKKSTAETTEKTAVEKQPVKIVAADTHGNTAGTGITAESVEEAMPAVLLDDDNRGEKTDKEILPEIVLPEILTEGLENSEPGNFMMQPAMVFSNINNRKFISDNTPWIKINRSSLPFNFAPDSYNSSSPRSTLKLMDLGIIYSYKNTWLINYETLNGLNPEKLGNTLPTFHKDIGLSSTLLLKDRHFIGLDLIIKSEAGQNYQQYINASYLKRNIQLNYSKLQGYYIWNRRIIPGQLLTGGYLARLNLGEESRGEEVITISDNYSNYDYGLLVGYQLSIFLQNKLIVRPGLRLNYNLVNIFQGDELTPGYLKDTRNLAAGFKISVSYRFSD